MSESIQEANGDSENESSTSLNQSYSTQSSSSSTENSSRASGDVSCGSCSGSTTTATAATETRDLQAPQAGSSDLTNGSNRHLARHNEPSSSRVVANETEESTSSILKNRSDEVTQGSQQRTGLKCDRKPESLKTGCFSSPKLDSTSEISDDQIGHDLDLTLLLPSTSHSTNDSFRNINQSLRHETLRPTPSASSSITDTNNNRNSSGKIELLSGFRKNFSKSASGGRLVSRNDVRSRVCDCLSQNCNEKEHSNRRQFIESYYNSRTRLPSANAMSTSNINTPLNRLSECDEITKRLLSSPIRTLNISDRSNRHSQTGEVSTSRRASLGTNSNAEKVSLITSSQFNPLGLIYSKNAKRVSDNQDDQQKQQQESHLASLTFASYSLLPKDVDGKLKLQQQQSRSLSVCQDDSSKLRFRNNTPNHSASLSRTVSLACESSPSRQLLTIIPLFGCDMEALEQFIKLGWILPPPIQSAIDYILAHGIDAIGIFRKSGVKSRILILKKRIETNQDASLEDFNRDNEFSIYDIADLVKMWFRELKPMPLLTIDLIRLISTFLQTEKQTGTCSSQQKRSGSPEEELGFIEKRGEELSLKQQIGAMVSPVHKALISKAMTFLATISSKSEINQMTSQNLAICLTPSLCATESDQKSILVAQGVLKYCIDNYRILF